MGNSTIYFYREYLFVPIKRVYSYLYILRSAFSGVLIQYELYDLINSNIHINPLEMNPSAA